MQLLGERGEEGDQSQRQAAQNGREPRGFPPAKGHHQRRHQPATGQLQDADPH